MKNKDLLKQLLDIKACQDAVEFVNGMDLKKAWKKCERADWLLWYICKTGMGTQQKRIHIICDCVETALQYVPTGEDRPKKAIEAARLYADNPTKKNKNAAADAAAYTANAAADAADAAAYAAYAAYDATKKKAHINMCKIIRKKFKGE